MLFFLGFRRIEALGFKGEAEACCSNGGFSSEAGEEAGRMSLSTDIDTGFEEEVFGATLSDIQLDRVTLLSEEVLGGASDIFVASDWILNL